MSRDRFEAVGESARHYGKPSTCPVSADHPAAQCSQLVLHTCDEHVEIGVCIAVRDHHDVELSA